MKKQTIEDRINELIYNDMKKPVIQIGIEELFMAKAGKAGWDKTFMGTIRRTKDVVYGKVKVNDKIIQASAKDQWALGEKLDELVLIALHGENLFQKSSTGISLN